MPDYKKFYHKTFNAITDAERLIAQASVILKTALQECEEAAMESEDSTGEDESGV